MAVDSCPIMTHHPASHPSTLKIQAGSWAGYEEMTGTMLGEAGRWLIHPVCPSVTHSGLQEMWLCHSLKLTTWGIFTLWLQI